MHQTVVGRVGRSRAPQAHIHDAYVRGYAVGIPSDVIQASDHRGVGAAARGVEHFHRINLRARRYADDIITVVLRGDNPGDVRSVTVVILG